MNIIAFVSTYNPTDCFKVSKFFAKPDTESTVSKPVHDSNGEPVDPFLLPPQAVTLSWPDDGERVSMHVYLNTAPSPMLFTREWMEYRRGPDGLLPSFSWDNINFGDWKDARVEKFDVKFPEVCFQIALFAEC